MKRRAFLETTVASAAWLTGFPASLAAIERVTGPGRLERRALGRTGEKLSCVGFGGIIVKDSTPEQAAQWVREAVERGVNYFDVAPTYGNAEERLGPALAPFRDRVFLACKTTQRRAREATEELETSLRRLQTDRFDLYQFHAVTTLEDVNVITGPGGALEAFRAARQAGKVRFIGFSAHSVEAALELMKRIEVDTILFPFNHTTWHAGNFGPQVLDRAREQGLGILALKTMAKGPWPKDAKREYPKCWYQPLAQPDEARLGVRFTLSHPIASLLPPGDERLFRLALDLATNFQPLTAAEAEAIKASASRGEPIFRHPPAA